MEVIRGKQYAALKFCFHLNKTSAEVYAMYRRPMESLFFPTAQLKDGLICLKREENMTVLIKFLFKF